MHSVNTHLQWRGDSSRQKSREQLCTHGPGAVGELGPSDNGNARCSSGHSEAGTLTLGNGKFLLGSHLVAGIKLQFLPIDSMKLVLGITLRINE